MVRKFKTEDEKQVWVFKVNMARRHLLPHEWGVAFGKLLEVRGVKRGRGSRNDKGTSPTIGEVAREIGVADSTAEYRMALADDYLALPPEYRASKCRLARDLSNRWTSLRGAGGRKEAGAEGRRNY